MFTSCNTTVPRDETASVQLGALKREAKPLFHSRTHVPSGGRGSGGGGCVPLTQSPKTSFPAKELDSAGPWNRLDKRNSSWGRQTVYSKITQTQIPYWFSQSPLLKLFKFNYKSDLQKNWVLYTELLRDTYIRYMFSHVYLTWQQYLYRIYIYHVPGTKYFTHISYWNLTKSPWRR